MHQDKANTAAEGVVPAPTRAQGALPSPLAPPQVLCPICKDAGYLRNDVPFGHPDWGKPVECQCKLARMNEQRRARWRELSQIDVLEGFQQASFETFHIQLPGVQDAYEASETFAGAPEGWLVLSGENGCGKTHLAVAIARRCLDQGRMVLFQVVPELLDYLRATFKQGAEEPYDEAFQNMKKAEVLILDDLGAQQSTPWANEKLFQLFNYRYNARLATVITINPMAIIGIDIRIHSRMQDRRLVRFVTMEHTVDYRPLDLDVPS